MPNNDSAEIPFSSDSLSVMTTDEKMVPGFHIIGRIASWHETVQGYPGDFMETIEGFSGRSRKPWRS